ncbi:MAG: PD40 domain-containing protein [Flavobacteriales bacterium]|nr:PD40 domain-containing protein [Flavobacteriales bacterium]
MTKFYTIFLLMLALLAGSCSVAQPTSYSSANKKAIKLFEEGRSYYDSRNNSLAELSLLQAIAKDPSFVEAELMLAYVYTDMREYKKALEHYKRCIQINPNFFPEIYASAAAMELKYGNYEEALEHFEKYLTFTDSPLMMKDLAYDGIRDCKFAIEALKHPVPFEPVNMGEAINSPLPEYYPAISVDGRTFLYTRRLNSEMTYTGFNEDFFVSYMDGDSWGKSVNVRPINSMTNEGAPTLSANGRFLIFTSCDNPVEGYGQDRKGYGSCDLFYAYSVGDNWTRPKNLGPKINTRNWETQPSFSSDGKTLYFIRGIGNAYNRQQDIWTCELTDDGTWTTPVKLSDKINTPGVEESVFIHPDGKTLYFSSNGHPGMGGLDIFMSKKDENGEWSTPVNLGYPINTYNDENSLLVRADGKIAYFASDREGGFGELDLYQFELPDAVKPEPVNYLKGKVFDAQTNKPLEAKFELIDLETGQLVVTSHSDPSTGEFLVSLPINKEYALNASSDGYLFFSENFVLKGGDLTKPFQKNAPMHKIEVGKSVVLKNVFFDTDKFELKPKSKVELDKLISFMQKNSTVKIELGGHTDSVGNAKANQILSDNRAKAVYDYLVEKGVDKTRLTTKGYGDTTPIADNDTEAGRAENRRTEFKIIAK